MEPSGHFLHRTFAALPRKGRGRTNLTPLRLAGLFCLGTAYPSPLPLPQPVEALGFWRHAPGRKHTRIKRCALSHPSFSRLCDLVSPLRPFPACSRAEAAAPRVDQASDGNPRLDGIEQKHLDQFVRDRSGLVKGVKLGVNNL